jgi:hypothetical protein
MFEILPRKTSKLLSRVQTPACSKNPDATCVGIPHEDSTIETLHSLKRKLKFVYASHYIAEEWSALRWCGWT